MADWGHSGTMRLIQMRQSELFLVLTQGAKMFKYGWTIGLLAMGIWNLSLYPNELLGGNVNLIGGVICISSACVHWKFSEKS